MNLSRFSNSFVGKTVASGSKVQGSAYPTLTATSTKDKFVLNGKALALMGLSEGSNVVMIDMNRGEQVVDDSNARWYLTQGWDKGKGQTEGAKIGRNGSFSYAGIYSAIMMNNPAISEASIKDMVAAGKGITRQTGTADAPKEAFIATQKVTFKVERLIQPNEVEGEPDLTEFEVAKGIFQPVFALTEMDIVAHTPRAEGEEDDATDEATE
ncbi:MAG: hypothetical protein M0R17_08180 [Candidatus Omnitrophica bacterium]|jgi:hypothetical protein|nr:hypothetical protein [Candidatus Omnitrophota bacterium]